MVFVRNAAAVLLSAVMLWFATGLHPRWWLTWIAPIPILLIAPRVPHSTAFLISALASLGGALNMWDYMHVRIGIPFAIAAMSSIGPAIVFGLCVILWRAMILRNQRWLATLALPVAFTAFEFCNTLTSPHSTFGSLAYSQIDFLPLIQLASITGLAGITFLLMLVPSAIATRTRGPIVATAAILIAVLTFGAIRLWRIPASTTITVGLASSDQRRTLFPHDASNIQQLAELYAAEARRLADSGAQLVIIPEKLAQAHGDDVRLFDAPLLAAAKGRIDLAAGLERWTTDKRNEVRLYASSGTIEALYEKHHMLPAFESYLVVGTDRVTITRPSGKWGIAICKDMDFPELSREYGRDGVGLLIVPAWDFVVDGWLHDRMAVMRGVESGFSIARAAKQGLLTVSDDRGHVLAEQHTGALPLATLLATAPVRHADTIYARWGDWFAWIDVAVLAAFVINELVRAGSRFRRRAPVSA